MEIINDSTQYIYIYIYNPTTSISETYEGQIVRNFHVTKQLRLYYNFLKKKLISPHCYN